MVKRKLTIKRSAGITVILQLLLVQAIAQIEGNVTDTAGNAIPEVFIIASDTTGQVIDSTRTDTIGYYAYRNLKKGKYNLTVQATGFETAVYKNIRVSTATPDSEPGPADISNAVWLQIVLERRKTSR